MQRNRGRRAAAAAHGAACANAAGHLHCQGRRDTAVWVRCGHHVFYCG